jgi:zinc protease
VRRFKQKQSSFFKNMASTPQNIFNKSFILEQGESKIQRVMPTDKSWADTDYK